MTHKEIQHIDVAHKVWKVARETLHCQVVQVLQETSGFQVNSEMFHCLGTQSEQISTRKLRFMNRLPRMEMFQILKSEGLVSFQGSCSNQISHYWSTFQLLVWFCKMNLKNLKCESTKGYIFYREPFSFSLRNFCFCFPQKMNYTNPRFGSKTPKYTENWILVCTPPRETTFHTSKTVSEHNNGHLICIFEFSESSERSPLV